MALSKAIVSQNTGHTNQYWRILETTVDAVGRVVVVVLGGYVSEQARLDNKEPGDKVRFVFGGNDFNQVWDSVDFPAVIYDLIKAHPDEQFAGAVGA